MTLTWGQFGIKWVERKRWASWAEIGGSDEETVLRYFEKLRRLDGRRIAIIDTEGITTRVGGTNRRKSTTIWIRKASLLVWDCESRQIDFEKTWHIAMPVQWSRLPQKTKKMWNFCYKIHGCRWTTKGEPYLKVLREIRSEIEGCEVWAKGKLLEDRFLNNVGMYGEPVCHSLGYTRELHVKELNDLGVAKYDTALENFCLEMEKQGAVREGKQGAVRDGNLTDRVLKALKSGKRLSHDPQQECRYFLGELLRIKGIPTWKL